jgi:hypothetical protein
MLNVLSGAEPEFTTHPSQFSGFGGKVLIVRVSVR